uniref:Uncharacterized protein n=1 Tax=Anopheles farauti TaxID=69004 RepID=A0A182Q0Z5_9DIPT
MMTFLGVIDSRAGRNRSEQQQQQQCRMRRDREETYTVKNGMDVFDVCMWMRLYMLPHVGPPTDTHRNRGASSVEVTGMGFCSGLSLIYVYILLAVPCSVRYYEQSFALRRVTEI